MSTRVLVIDDSPTVVLAVRRMLAGLEGLRLDVLESPLDAYAKLNGDEPPDLILLDLSMPALAGSTFGGFIRKFQRSHIPIVIYSSEPEEVREKVALEIGAASTISKECTSSQLRLAVSRALKS